jgi:hypothetical protein
VPSEEMMAPIEMSRNFILRMVSPDSSRYFHVVKIPPGGRSPSQHRGGALVVRSIRVD